jgi:hypothetical protein
MPATSAKSVGYFKKWPITFHPSSNAKLDFPAASSSYVVAASALTPAPQMASGTKPWL